MCRGTEHDHLASKPCHPIQAANKHADTSSRMYPHGSHFRDLCIEQTGLHRATLAMCSQRLEHQILDNNNLVSVPTDGRNACTHSNCRNCMAHLCSLPLPHNHNSPQQQHQPNYGSQADDYMGDKTINLLLAASASPLTFCRQVKLCTHMSGPCSCVRPLQLLSSGCQPRHRCSRKTSSRLSH